MRQSSVSNARARQPPIGAIRSNLLPLPLIAAGGVLAAIPFVDLDLLPDPIVDVSEDLLAIAIVAGGVSLIVALAVLL